MTYRLPFVGDRLGRTIDGLRVEILVFQIVQKILIIFVGIDPYLRVVAHTQLDRAHR